MPTTVSQHVEYIRGNDFIRFALVGATSTILDMVVLNIGLYAHVLPTVAVTCGYLAGATNGYYLNSIFVFYKNRSAFRYGKYIFVTAFGLFITNGIVYYLVDSRHAMGTNAAKLIAVVIVFFWNYFWSKFWAFQ
jgi:putative flippase GtrA